MLHGIRAIHPIYPDRLIDPIQPAQGQEAEKRMLNDFYKRAVMESPVAYAYHKIICDQEGIPADYEFIEVNAAFEAFTGLKGADIIGRRITGVAPGIRDDEFDWVNTYGEIALDGGKTSFTQFSAKFGSWYGVTVYSPEKNYFITYFSDVSQEIDHVAQIGNLKKTVEEVEFLQRTDRERAKDEAKRAKEDLMSSRRQLRDIIDFLPDATLAIDGEGQVIIWNKAIEKMTGISAKEMIGKGGHLYSIPFYGDARKQLMDLVHVEDEEIAARYSSIIRDGDTLASEAFCPALYDGKGAWIYAKASPLHDQAGNIVGTIESIRDITLRKQMEADLANDKHLLETTLRSIGDGVISTDSKGIVVLMNRVAESLTGWTQETALGKPLEDVFNVMDEVTRERNRNIMPQVPEGGKIHESAGQGILLSRDGCERPIEDSAAPILDDNGEIAGAVFVFRDHSVKKQKQDEMLYLSYHDPLTGLYNRRFYEEELQRLDTERNLPMSIVMGDVNRLKQINDSFGHVMGDELLIKVADVMKKGCRADDVIARIGGDEFVILLPKTTSLEAEGLISRVSELVSAEQVGDTVLSISFGYCTKNSMEEKTNDIFRNAEDHMYRNKLAERSIRGEEA